MSLRQTPLEQKQLAQFLHYLVGTGYNIQDSYEDGLSLELLEQQEAPKQEKTGWDDRVLLDVEKARVAREEAAKKQQQKTVHATSELFHKKLLTFIEEKLTHPEVVLNKLLKLSDAAVDLLAHAALPNPRLSVLGGIIDLNPEIARRILFLVNNPKFMKQLKREPKKVTKLQAAIGMIGIDVIRLIIPLMLFKYRIAMDHPYSRLAGRKLWRAMLTLSLTCEFQLEKQEYRRPLEGIMLGFLYCLGPLAIYQQFMQSFEELKYQFLSDARNQGNKAFHDALFVVEPQLDVLEQLWEKHQEPLSVALAKLAFDDAFPHLIYAMEEEAEDKVFDQRGVLGQSLFRGVRFSLFEQLRNAKLFDHKDLPAWITHMELTQEGFEELHKAQLFRVDYHKFT